MRAVRSLGTAVVGVTLGTYALNKPAFYSAHIYLADNVVVPILKMVDPETAHEWAVSLARFGPRDGDLDDPVLGQRLWGLRFGSPLGLAAGFDKDGRALGGMLDLGLTFVEVGSVTPLAQPGNPRPRVFRLEGDNAVINRYGFNSAGAESTGENLRAFRATAHLHRYGLVGVNAGKNKETSEENAKEDYASIITKLGPQADYLVINVSSPNTPGLRQLQGKETLRSLVRHCQAARDAVHAERWGLTAAGAFGSSHGASQLPKPHVGVKNTRDHIDAHGNLIIGKDRTASVHFDHGAKHIPLLVKIAPDLTDQQKRDVAEVCIELGVDGIIAGNTTVTRPSHLTSPEKAEAGGLSGEPVKALSTQLVADMYFLTKGKIPIIGVGGIGNSEDAFEKISAGASLVQVYTMMSVNGPGTIKKIKTNLASLLHTRGFLNISDAVGTQYKQYLSPSFANDDKEK